MSRFNVVAASEGRNPWSEDPVIYPLDATLLQPLERQGNDGALIDPVGVSFDPEREYVVYDNFDYHKPVGYCRVSRKEDGTLHVLGKLHLPPPEPTYAVIGVYVRKAELASSGQVISASNLMEVGLTMYPNDPTHPAIRVPL